MKPQRPPTFSLRSVNLNSFMRVGMLVALIALIGIPLFSSSSASSLGGASKTSKQVFSAKVGRTATFPLIMPQLAPAPAIATFDSTCVTPDSEFNLGQTVCATATGTGGALARRRFSWVDPEGFVRKFTSIASDPQNDTFTLPITPTTTFANGQTANNVGTWKVNIISSRGSLVASSSFIVKDPANATADLSVVKTVSPANEQVAAGSSSTFDIFVKNSGPDTAQTVVLTDVVPANTSFVSMTQSSGPAFSCTTPTPGTSGTITCTIASLAVGASAIFDFAFTVNAGTPPNTVISNTATISSNTTERNSADNSSTANAFVTAGGGGGGGTCTVSCPSDITTPANTTDSGGNPGAVVHFVPPTGEGSCGTVTVNHCNDCFFPVGTTTVSGTADSGESCSFTVTVTAAGAPTITCPSDKSATADSNCQATVDPGTPTTTGSNVTVTSSRSDGKPLSDPYPAGVTTITWTATNSNGSASCDQTVTVNDTTDPTITCPANVTANNDPGQCSATIDPGTATATDNCTVTVTGTRSDNEALNAPYPVGTTTITWTATDGSGNTASCPQTVTVTDNENPTITCPANVTANTDPGTCSANVNPGTATATDNCGTATVSGSRSDGQVLNAPYPKGTTTITWTATDGSGHTSSCTQTVTVTDNEPPSITCPADVTTNTEPGTCAAHVTPGTATATDNCGPTTVTGSRSDGKPLTDTYPGGTTTITWTATDSSGNQSSCTQTVTVIDNEPPVIVLNGQTPSMWPPNHKYHTFGVTNFVTGVNDNCDTISVSSVVIVKVTSDEIENGNGDGNTLNDIVIAPDCRSVQLRSEREGNGNGRVYRIFFSVTDASGNVGTGSATVVVQHNPGETAVDSGPHYTVYCGNL